MNLTLAGDLEAGQTGVLAAGAAEGVVKPPDRKSRASVASKEGCDTKNIHQSNHRTTATVTNHHTHP